MVQANINNTPVSKVLTEGQSVTVPSGETWKVTVSLSTVKNGKATSMAVHVNGYPVAGRVNNSDGNNSNDAKGTTTWETVFDAGDTISVVNDGKGGSIHIGGFKV